ncbi:hypothetical protein [Streptomyces luteireticuli]|uniref:hypothetical protein n=1 Tax=Streptomyces luteireticuli TaxID=173858 RepID=UPI003558B8A5
MTPPGIDDLLADAAVPTTPVHGFDVGVALRRLAADAARNRQTREALQGRQARKARQMLDMVSRWTVTRPEAPAQLEDLAVGDRVNVDGVLVFACLLRLTGYPDSAQFWWQLAAGAGNRIAAYCLHLHHVQRDEQSRAWLWLEQFSGTSGGHRASLPPDYYGLPEKARQFIREHGTTGPLTTEGLKDEIHRLAAAASGTIIGRPDNRLARRITDLA